MAVHWQPRVHLHSRQALIDSRLRVCKGLHCLNVISLHTMTRLHEALHALLALCFALEELLILHDILHDYWTGPHLVNAHLARPTY